MKYLFAFLLVLPLSGCELLPVALVGPPGKDLVCHKGKKTLELPREAISAHLGLGDYGGRSLFVGANCFALLPDAQAEIANIKTAGETRPLLFLVKAKE